MWPSLCASSEHILIVRAIELDLSFLLEAMLPSPLFLRASNEGLPWLCFTEV
jgi:hypothetical protein